LIGQLFGDLSCQLGDVLEDVAEIGTGESRVHAN
jgi:hypothetical protein